MNTKALKETSVKVDGTDGSPLLDADRDKIKQVFLNLISNAIKYNHKNGSITMRVETRENNLIIIFQDTGIGIPEEALPHLFQKFFRVHEHEDKIPGTGLGLSICRQIVNGHGGRIEVSSKVGVGTVFTVFLPRTSRTQPIPN
jgi:signal transduction histidine kinase